MRPLEFSEKHQKVIEELLASKGEPSDKLKEKLKDLLHDLHLTIECYAHVLDLSKRHYKTLDIHLSQLCLLRDTLQKEWSKYGNTAAQPEE